MEGGAGSRGLGARREGTKGEVGVRVQEVGHTGRSNALRQHAPVEGRAGLRVWRRVTTARSGRTVDRGEATHHLVLGVYLLARAPVNHQPFSDLTSARSAAIHPSRLGVHLTLMQYKPLLIAEAVLKRPNAIGLL
jgi:hypothetical protein